MSGYRIALRAGPAEVISRLPPELKRAVKAAVRQLSAHPAAGPPLHGELEGWWRYRVRRYRLVYGIDRARRVVDIVAVGERRSIYEEVSDLLRSEK